jgi:hypothetical protein
MAAPAYSTDLTTINDGQSGTWVEMTGWANGGVPQVNTTEWFIQGTGCVTATMNNKTTIQSIAFNNGSDLSGSFSAGDCVFMWQACLAGGALDLYANGGLRCIIGSGQGDFKAWDTGGKDRPPYPKGAWWNVAVDPTFTPVDDTVGSPTSAYQYFGSGLLPASTVSKGEMHNVDAIRYGRGEIKALNGDLSNGYATFGGLAQYNDYNDATNGYNVFGLFEETGNNAYLWKGLIKIGDNTTAADFRDSNRKITVDDCPKTYAAFNRIEIENASTNVVWDRISFTSANSTGLSRGQFEMLDNATVTMTDCTFEYMSTFVFQSNASITGGLFLGCGQITHGGADFEAVDFAGYEGTAGTAYVLYAVNADPDGELDNCSFTKGTAATHALEFDATNTPTTITLRNIDFSGYNASHGQNDSTLYFPSTTKSYTVNLVGCTGNISYRVGSGGSVSLVINPVALQINVKDQISKSAIEGAAVTIWAGATGPLPYQDSVTITRSGSTATVVHTAHGLETGQKVEIKGADQNEYNRIKTITYISDNSYSYQVSGTPATPATGTIIATAVIIDELTNASGIVSDTRSYTADQSFDGKSQKGSHEPVYVDAPVSGTIDKDNGREVDLFMIPD